MSEQQGQQRPDLSTPYTDQLQRNLDFYREAYERAFARTKALEESNTRLYERDALHTESSGMQAAEIRSLKAQVEKLKAALQHAVAEADGWCDEARGVPCPSVGMVEARRLAAES